MPSTSCLTPSSLISSKAALPHLSVCSMSYSMQQPLQHVLMSHTGGYRQEVGTATPLIWQAGSAGSAPRQCCPQQLRCAGRCAHRSLLCQVAPQHAALAHASGMGEVGRLWHACVFQEPSLHDTSQRLTDPQQVRCAGTCAHRSRLCQVVPPHAAAASAYIDMPCAGRRGFNV